MFTVYQNENGDILVIDKDYVGEYVGEASKEEKRMLDTFGIRIKQVKNDVYEKIRAEYWGQVATDRP